VGDPLFCSRVGGVPHVTESCAPPAEVFVLINGPAYNTSNQSAGKLSPLDVVDCTANHELLLLSKFQSDVGLTEIHFNANLGSLLASALMAILELSNGSKKENVFVIVSSFKSICGDKVGVISTSST